MVTGQLTASGSLPSWMEPYGHMGIDFWMGTGPQRWRRLHNGLPRRLEADRRETPLAGCKVAVAEHGQRGRRVRPGAGKEPAEAQRRSREAA